MPGFDAGDVEARLTLDRTPFQRDLDKAQRQAREFEKKKFSATLDADRSAFTKAINQARAAGVRFSQAKYATKLSADRHELTRALRKAAEDVRRFNQSRGNASVGLNTAEVEQAVKKIDRITHNAGITVANNFRSPWRRFKWPAIFAGITAAAMAVPAAVIGAGGAVAALAGAFTGPVKALKAFGDAQKAVAMGAPDAAAEVAKFEAAMAKLTPEGRAFVRQANSMRKEMGKFSKEMQTATLPGFTEFLKGIEQAVPAITRGSAAIGRSISHVMESTGALLKSPVFQGQIEQAFKNSVPVVHSLGMFIRNLFRDITTFTAKTRTLGIGLANMIDGISQGFTGFFDQLVPYSDTLGQSFAGVGGIIKDLFTALGKFSGILSTGLAPGLEILRSVLDRVYTVVNNLVEGAMPGLTVAWSAFGSVIGGVASALAPIAGLLGGVVGALAPFALALKGIDVLSFGAVGAQFSALGGKIKDTEGKMGKLKTAARGLSNLAFGPLGLAVLAVGAVLTALGQQQQRAAERAAELRQRTQELTQAIIEDGGAIGMATRASVAKSLADKGAYASARQLGLSFETVTRAALGNDKAYKAVHGSLMRQAEAIADNVNLADGEVTAYDKKAIALLTLERSLKLEHDASKAAAKAALEMKAAENGVTVATLEHWNALNKLNAELFKSANANLAYREATFQQEQATKAATEALKTSKKGSEEHKQAVLAQERAILAQIQAKYEQVKATNATLPPERAAAKATAAMEKEAFKLAGTLKGPLPPALAEIIGGMSSTRAKALGARDGVDAAGRAVRTLPNGKTVYITANTQQFWNRINQIMSTPLQKTLNIVLGTVPSMAAAAARAAAGGAKGGIEQYATGGLTFNGKRVTPMGSGSAKMVRPGTPRLIGDNTAVRESFIPHDGSRRSLSILSETNRMMGSPLGGQVAAAPALSTAQIAQAVSAAIRAAMVNMGIEITIGGEKIAEIAEVAVVRHNRATVRGIKAGAGRNR